MNKILYCGYRPWAINPYRWLCWDGFFMDLATKPEEIKEGYEIVILAGWSWIVPDNIIENSYAVCVHPSDLPNFAGGSPLQHQIMSGVTHTKSTLFKVTKELDAGPVLAKVDLDLSGSMKDIFEQLTTTTYSLVKNFLSNYPPKTEQPHDKPVIPHRRLRPEQSEITLESLSKCTALQLYNKIRALQDPYPNAYITCADGKRVYLTEAKLDGTNT